MVWGWLSAAIGAASTALLIAYGTASGTWVDEHQVTDAPSVFGLLIVTALAVVLFVGGLIVGITGAARARRA
jgi:hypothetical protein